MMTGIGLFLTWSSQLADYRLLIDGMAFIMVGLGILASWTALDTGSNVEVREYALGRRMDRKRFLDTGSNVKVRETGMKNLTSMEIVKVSRENVEADGDDFEVGREMVKANREILEVSKQIAK